VADTVTPCIYVFAGTNGAGKSSVVGTGFSAMGAEYFNPDEAARQARLATHRLSDEQANSFAWNLGRRQLEQAIAERSRYAFETTLGGNTITQLLEKALDEKIEVRVKFVGLATPELHIARVNAGVAAGGHDIPEEKICERFHKSRLNLIRLLPKLTELLLFDNTKEADPKRGFRPEPVLLLHIKKGRIVDRVSLSAVPQWAKPIIQAALKLVG
jgi:predicted ABC-type ATPase